MSTAMAIFTDIAAQNSVDEEIAHHERCIQALKTQRNGHSAICKLSDDVLGHIFATCDRNMDTRVHLASICKRFREVALGDGTFWSFIHLASPRLSLKFLARSAGSSLHVTVPLHPRRRRHRRFWKVASRLLATDISERVVDLTLKSTTQIPRTSLLMKRIADLCSRTSAPQLHSLCVYLEIPHSETMLPIPLLKGIIHVGVSPLRSLELHEAPFWDEEAAIPSFPCLTSITIRSRISNPKFSLHWLVRLLRNALNVEDVDVKTIQETQDFSVVQAFHSPPVFLAKLKQLTLDFDDPSDSRFFALVTFPEYTAVSVRFSGTRPEVGYFSNLAFLFARLSSVRSNEPVSVEVSGVGIQEAHNYRFSINHSKEKGDPPILHISLIWCITAQPLDENIRIIQAYARDCVSTLSFACLFSPTSAGLMSNLLRIFRFAKKITTTFCHISVLNELVNTLSPNEELVNPFLETLAVSEWALNDEESREVLLNILRTRSERGKRLPTLMVGRCDFDTTAFEEFTHVDRETLF